MSNAGLRERKFERTRALLIDTAVELCLSGGYENTTVEQIAASADVSPRTFSRYFSAKDAVFMAVLEPIADEVFEEMQKQIEWLGPLEALRAAHVTVFQRIADRPYGKPSAHHLVKILRVLSSSEALARRAVEYRDPRVMATLTERMSASAGNQKLELATTLFNLAITTACVNLVADTETEHLSARLMIERLQGVLADLAEVVGDLDLCYPESDRNAG